MAPGDCPRGTHILSRQHIGGVTATIRVGHLDQMDRCAACGRVICDHPDAVFQGVISIPTGTSYSPTATAGIDGQDASSVNAGPAGANACEPANPAPVANSHLVHGG